MVIRSSPLADPRLDESSGVAVSRRYPGLLWTHNDSGDDAWVYATDTAGRALGRVRLDGIESRDWEDLALGPCPEGECLYIADTGDNAGRRDDVVLLRIPEPGPPTTPETASTAVESLRVIYPSGPEDVEAMFVDQTGAVHLLGKGRRGTIRHYRFPASAWEGTGPATADDLGLVPIPVDRATGQLVTAAALAPDGRSVAIRTYHAIYFATLVDTGALTLANGVVCDIRGIDYLGEAIDWIGDAEGTLVLTSERARGQRGTVTLVRCPEAGGA